MALHECEVCTVHVFQPPPDRELERRIRGEYSEMPGLRLSAEQARRLWSLDSDTCSRVLGTLVGAGYLHRDPHGRYARTHAGY